MRRLVLALVLTLSACSSPSEGEPAGTYLRLDGRTSPGEARYQQGIGPGGSCTYVQVLVRPATSLSLRLPCGALRAASYPIYTDVQSHRADAALLLGDGVTSYQATDGSVTIERVGDRLVGRFTLRLAREGERTVSASGRFEARDEPLVMVEG